MTRAIVLAVCLVALLPVPAPAVDRAPRTPLVKPAANGEVWTAAQKKALALDIDTFVANAAVLRGAHVGLVALDTQRGDVLYARNGDDAFVPASTFKLLTGSVALAALGPDYRFRTVAYIDTRGSRLILKMAGDPLLRAVDFNGMAQAVRSAGVRTLSSGIGVDSSAFVSAPYPPGWSWDDFPYDYAPALSAAAIEENVVHLTVTPGEAVGRFVEVTAAPLGRAVVAPRSEDCVTTAAMTVMPAAMTSPPDVAPALDLVRTPGGCVEVTGTLPLGAAPQTLDAAVPNPSWYVRACAQAALRTAHVAAADTPAGSAVDARTAGVDSDGRIVWTHDGEPLRNLLADMWLPSDNLVAEMLLRSVGARASGRPGSADNGAEAERAWLRGIGVDPGALTIADGSGLSSYDRLSPQTLVAILQADWTGPNRDVILDDLPVAGVRGTLETRFAGTLAAGRTFAKTGSVSHARGLAGYLATLHHGAVTFAWLVDDWMSRDDDALDALRATVLSRIAGDAGDAPPR